MQKFKRYQKELQVNIEMWEIQREHKTKHFLEVEEEYNKKLNFKEN